MLLERAVLPDARALDDVLAHQAHRLPVASLCYVLGYASERPLVAALAVLRGHQGVVLDESVIHLEVLGSLGRDAAVRARVLPLFEDARRVVVAAADPGEAAAALGELERVRGKRVEVLIALEITLARAIRGCYQARARGDSYWVGIEAVVDPSARAGKISLVTPGDPDSGRVDDEARAHRALLDDVTKEIAATGLLLDDDVLDRVLIGDDESFEVLRTPSARRDHHRVGVDDSDEALAGRAWSSLSSSGGGSATGSGSSTTDAGSIGLETPWPSSGDVDDDATINLIAELDAVVAVRSEGPARVLVVDDDLATRHFLIKELEQLGYVTASCEDGSEAVGEVRQGAPDLVICDILLPEIDGFLLCRAIKRSRLLGHVPVVLMSAVIDSGRVTDEVLARYGADAYLEKPLDTRQVHRVIRDLLGRRRGKLVSGEDGFQEAIGLYERGDIDGAIKLLRVAVSADPASAKYRFVLANLLQRNANLNEAIDEYESVVQLEPDYFPALTRLAYLYFKQGLMARAVDTWRRSLPLCGDPHLRRNIELFMRKLIVDMGALGS